MPRGLSAGGLVRGRRLVTAAPISGLFLELGKFLRHLVELAFPFRVRLLAFGDLEEHLHQRRHADGLDDRLLDAPGEHHGDDQRQRSGRAREQRDQAGDRCQNQQEDQEGQTPDHEGQPECVLKKRLVVLSIQYQRCPAGGPGIVRLHLDVVSQYHFIEIGQRKVDDGVDELGDPLDTRDGQEVGNREEGSVERLEYALDQLIKGVLKAFNRAFFTIANFLPIPGIQGIAKFINTIINLSLTYLDEVILAYNIKMKADNPWAASRTALVLYAQNYKSFLKNAFWLAFVSWGLTFLVFLLILAPVAGLVSLFPGTAGPLALIIAVVFAWGIKQAVIEPIGMTALMQVFFKVTEGQQPNPEWEGKLDKVSKKFSKLKEKAADWGSSDKPSVPDQPTG